MGIQWGAEWARIERGAGKGGGKGGNGVIGSGRAVCVCVCARARARARVRSGLARAKRERAGSDAKAGGICAEKTRKVGGASIAGCTLHTCRNMCGLGGWAGSEDGYLSQVALTKPLRCKTATFKTGCPYTHLHLYARA